MKKQKKTNHRLTKDQLKDQLAGFFQQNASESYSLKDIFRQLHITTHPTKMLAISILDELAWDDYLVKQSDNRYKLSQSNQVQEGTFVRKANGKNSFIPDEGGKPIFVSERNSLSAMSGDRVRVSFMARRKKHIKEAQVIEILKRARETFVGRLRVDKDIAFLVTQENLLVHNIIIPRDKLKGGKTDDKAVVRITQWPTDEHKTPIGEVIDILGVTGDNTTEMHAILAQYGLPYKYPKNVEDEANKISDKITEKDLEGREDFRQIFTCTIDPKDAKDFDDALSIQKLQNGLWQVGVHIADVSHYVTEGSIIDKEAQQRATSVYLVDRTIPMLPERLCNYICSLRPNEEKLCYSVIFDLDEDAMVRASRIVHTVIRSDRRFAYEEVQQILEDNGVVDGKGEPAPPLKNGMHYKGEYAEQLIRLDALAKKLRAERFKNGAVKFEGEELHFDIDENGKPIRCYFKRSKDANKLIEEFMLLANRTVAEAVGNPGRGKTPKTLPYRIHENPDPQKLESLRDFIARFGYRLKTAGTKTATAKSLNKLMDDVEGKREAKLVQTVALRAMMKAKYSTHNIGHFGLAFDYYTHFTSPIRRYPDTMVHRLLTRYQQGEKSANQKYYEQLCEHCSDMEQIATNAERESIKYKMVEFMGEHIGESFDAHISGIQSYGVYAEIDENHCEGLVPIRDLGDDYYEYDEDNYCLRGRRNHHVYQLGDPIRITVASANVEKRQLDFVLAEDDENAKKENDKTKTLKRKSKK